MITWVALATVAAFVVVPAQRAVAAVPTFPDNLVVFPDRDFLSSEGFDAHIGESALVEVSRPGVGIVGSTEVILGPGGVPFEVNHPGGFCWGNDLTPPPAVVSGTPAQITPDVVPGDQVIVTFADGTTSDVTTQDAFVTAVNYVDGAVTFTVTGHVGPLVNRDNVEQRIVNPALTETTVGRRDIRAVPGPVADNGAYTSVLEFDLDGPDTFRATYVFDDAAVANTAATGGGERLLSWQVTDVNANRQGITIAEFGEIGGPGFGGCPNGPLQSGPPGPTNVTAALQANGSIVVTWTPAVAIPGAPAISGYRVHAVAQTVIGNQQVEIGRRITEQAATGATITGLLATELYDVYVASVSNAGETFPAIHAPVVVDAIPPVVTANPPAGTYGVPQQVTLSANEAGTQVYFTTDGSDVLDAAGDPAVNSTLFTAPITVDVDTTLRYAAFDPSGNVSQGAFVYVITNTPVPASPTFLTDTAGDGSITLTWTDVPADPSITEYTVRVYDAATGGAVVAQQVLGAPAGSTTITGLTADTPYWATIMAANANGYGPESARRGPITPHGAVVANAGPDQSVPRGTQSTTFSLTGVGSTEPGTAFLWEQVSPGEAATIASPNTRDTSVTLPAYHFPFSSNDPITFRLTVTGTAGTDTDDVVVSPVPDQVAITSAQWKVNDFRVNGTGNLVGAVVTVHRGALSGPVLGTAQVVAGGTFSLRLRNAQTPTPAVLTITIESTAGGTVSTPFPVAQR